MRVSVQRLRSDIESNGEYGNVDAETGRGRTVFTGTDADEGARDFLVARLEDAGLDVRVDQVGNVVGRWSPPSADDDADPVATGSHLDSVPEGGLFDGPLGVYGALEAVRTMQRTGFEPARPVNVVCFTGEEGQRFRTPLLGSKVATGAYPVEDALALTDDDGETLEAALSSIGYQGAETLHAGDWDAWLELHVEQGPRLEDRDAPAGVVSSISGITQCEVEITGNADHAGTTPMGTRRDALAAASEFVLDVETAATDAFETRSDAAVGTVGSATVEPDSANVVPSTVTLTLDLRDVDADTIDYLVRRSRESLARIERERGVSTEFDRYFDVEPESLSERCVSALRTAGKATGQAVIDLHSGAGHDTMSVARVTDAGLVFAQSRNGVSHSPREWTDWEDCARATQVLEEALRTLAAD